MRRRRRSVLIALVLAGLAGAAHGPAAAEGQGAPEPEPAAFAEVIAALARVKTSDARFSEEKRMALLSRPLVLRGTLHYEAPDVVIKQVTSPGRERFEVRGERVTLDNGRDEPRSWTIRDIPEIQAFVESIRATLAGDVTSLRRHFTVTFTGTVEDWTLTLQPRLPDLAKRVAGIVIRGHGAQLRSIETRDADGDRSLMTIHDATP